MGTYYTYNCQVCGKTQSGKSKVRRCGYCLIQLCRKCQTHGVCPRHDEMLLPKEKSSLRTGKLLYDKGCWIGLLSMFAVMPLFFLIGTAAIALVFIAPIVVIVLFCYLGNNIQKTARAKITERLKQEGLASNI
jgi:hypothetical protein